MSFISRADTHRLEVAADAAVVLIDFIESTLQVFFPNTGENLKNVVAHGQRYPFGRGTLRHLFFHALGQFCRLIADQVIVNDGLTIDTQQAENDRCTIIRSVITGVTVQQEALLSVHQFSHQLFVGSDMIPGDLARNAPHEIDEVFK